MIISNLIKSQILIAQNGILYPEFDHLMGIIEAIEEAMLLEDDGNSFKTMEFLRFCNMSNEEPHLYMDRSEEVSNATVDNDSYARNILR